MDELIFKFLEEEESLNFSCTTNASLFGCSEIETFQEEEEEEQENENTQIIDQETKAFWQSQEDILKAILYRTTSLESRIRKVTKDVIKELMNANESCVCKKIKQLDLCKICLHQVMSDRLRDAGFNCIICKSKWRASPEFPAGEHTYMQVIQRSEKLSNEVEIKVIIELNFRSEFEIARASEEYNNLIKCLPEVYVGKIERVGALLRLLCAASKKLLKERKMHMAPWRKQKYMEAKWQSGPHHHHGKLLQTRQMEIARPRASMLTFDFIDSFPLLPSQGITIN